MTVSSLSSLPLGQPLALCERGRSRAKVSLVRVLGGGCSRVRVIDAERDDVRWMTYSSHSEATVSNRDLSEWTDEG